MRELGEKGDDQWDLEEGKGQDKSMTCGEKKSASLRWGERRNRCVWMWSVWDVHV